MSFFCESDLDRGGSNALLKRRAASFVTLVIGAFSHTHYLHEIPKCLFLEFLRTRLWTHRTQTSRAAKIFGLGGTRLQKERTVSPRDIRREIRYLTLT